MIIQKDKLKSAPTDPQSTIENLCFLRVEFPRQWPSIRKTPSISTTALFVPDLVHEVNTVPGDPAPPQENQLRRTSQRSEIKALKSSNSDPNVDNRAPNPRAPKRPINHIR